MMLGAQNPPRNGEGDRRNGGGGVASEASLSAGIADPSITLGMVPFPVPGRSDGFTLVELLVSLLIFGMLSAAGVALLSVGVRAQDAATERLGEISELRRLGAILTSDLAQAAPRISRDETGALVPAFSGGSGQETVALTLVRRGWENFDNAPRSSLQKVQYRLSEDRLERVAYRFVDGAVPMEPVTLVEGVRSLRLRYRDRRGEWRERWDPAQPVELPRAVEMIADTGDGGLRQLFLVGAGA